MNHSIFLQALGWALVNSLWQFGLLWLLFLLYTIPGKISSPRKHGFALALSMGGTAWFVFDLVRGCWTTESPTSPANDSVVSDLSGYVMLNGMLQTFRDHYLGYITLVYLLVITLQFIRFFYSFYYSHRVYNAGLSKAKVELRLYVQKMTQQLQIKRRVQVFVSEYVDTPLVIGFLKPTILMPLACINHLTMLQLEAILLHELAHIKRNDYLVNVMVASMEIVFFFNPFARMLAHSIKKEREYTCDDWVMQHQFDPHSYASALLTLEKSRIGYLQAGIAATGASRTILLHRVQRILQVPQREPVSVYRIASGLVVCALVWLVTLKPVSAKKEPPVYESDPASLLASRLPSHKRQLIEHPVTIVMGQPGMSALPSPTPEKAAVKPVKRSAEPATPEEETVFPVAITNDVSQLSLLQDAVNVEKRNFSIPEEVQPELPVVAQVYSFPYVPSSSFYFSTDTVKPTRTETYHEQAAKETMLKTKKALSQVDWKAIQKRLPSRVSIQLIKKQLEQSINQLNWEQINQEVRDSINQQTLRNTRAALYNEYTEMNKWKTRQQQVEDLQNQLLQQQKTYKVETEKKSLELQKELAKAKIVIYL